MCVCFVCVCVCVFVCAQLLVVTTVRGVCGCVCMCARVRQIIVVGLVQVTRQSGGCSQGLSERLCLPHQGSHPPYS